jgi:transcriptional regulator with XRE-family HTH domain
MNLNVKELRLKKGLSQQELAEKTGIPKGRINNWEQGNGSPKAQDYIKLRDFFESIEIESSHETMENKQNKKGHSAVELAAYKAIIEGNTDYILMHKDLLQDKHRITSLEQMQENKHVIDRLLDQNMELIARIIQLEAKLPGVEKVK